MNLSFSSSGAMCDTVPFMMSRGTRAAPGGIRLAMPKSPIFALHLQLVSPLGCSKTLDAFRSLCTTPMECRYFIPSTTCFSTHSCAADDLTCLVAATSSGWRRISRSEPPMQNSVMMYVFQRDVLPRDGSCSASPSSRMVASAISAGSVDGPV